MALTTTLSSPKVWYIFVFPWEGGGNEGEVERTVWRGGRGLFSAVHSGRDGLGGRDLCILEQEAWRAGLSAEAAAVLAGAARVAPAEANPHTVPLQAGC